MAQPDAVSIVIIPAYNEAAVIADVVSALARAAGWREILVVDDGSADETGRGRAAAGARVIRHPYNKGNGAAVKTGVRRATGEHILILDADGQHRVEDALNVIPNLGDTISSSARAILRATRRSSGGSAMPG